MLYQERTPRITASSFVIFAGEKIQLQEEQQKVCYKFLDKMGICWYKLLARCDIWGDIKDCTRKELVYDRN